jgi:hypothetical protein
MSHGKFRRRVSDLLDGGISDFGVGVEHRAPACLRAARHEKLNQAYRWRAGGRGVSGKEIVGAGGRWNVTSRGRWGGRIAVIAYKY